VTTASLVGTRGDNGWFTSAVTVSLQAMDDLSGVAQVRLNGRPADTLTLDAEGRHVVEFAAEDLAGNRELTQTLTVQIDRTPPEVSVQAISQANGSLALDVHAQDAGSGVQGGVVGVLVEGQLIQWWNFAGDGVQVVWDGALPDGRVLPPGAYTVWAAAHNAAGLDATASTDAVLALAATLLPTPTSPAPASSRPTTPPAPTNTPEPPATETPFVPSPTQAVLPTQPMPTRTPQPVTPQAGWRSQTRNADRDASSPAWVLLTVVPALALAFGAVHIIDPRPRALRRLVCLVTTTSSLFLGDPDD
jgi:hypothetical protein